TLARAARRSARADDIGALKTWGYLRANIRSSTPDLAQRLMRVYTGQSQDSSATRDLSAAISSSAASTLIRNTNACEVVQAT
ncbi:hypothetical protein, partial [Xanthomonas oryzae]|uniref:hypothetical protein n=1 Tax=Xanthomonas oryzae TaxID=347 RepID=UPI001C670F6D